MVGSNLLDKLWFELKWIYYAFGHKLSYFVLIIVISLVNGLIYFFKEFVILKRVIRVQIRL